MLLVGGGWPESNSTIIAHINLHANLCSSNIKLHTDTQDNVQGHLLQRGGRIPLTIHLKTIKFNMFVPLFLFVQDMEFYGVMRFYFQDAGQKVATKCMRISSTACTNDVVNNLIEKFRPDIRMLSVPEYALYEIHENGGKYDLGVNVFFGLAVVGF